MPVDYQQGKIYKIWSPSYNVQYVGSTTQKLSQRLATHKKNYNLYNNIESGYCKYTTSYEVLKYPDYRIELLEKYPTNEKCELLKKEGEYIKTLKCVNKIIPGRTVKQYLIDNKEKIQKYKKQYRIDNKDKIRKYKKQYSIDNKDAVSLKKKELTECTCGSILRKAEISRHYKTKKHCKYIKNIDVIHI